MLTYYDDAEGVVTIKGQCLYRASAFNYLKTLKDKDIFSFVVERIEALDPIKEGYDQDSLMFGTMLYTFEFSCTLKGHYSVSWALFVDGVTPTPLTSLQTATYSVGSTYTIADIASYSADGVNYNLTNVTVNGMAITAQELQEAITNNTLTGKVSSNMDIQFFYTADNGGEG